MPCSDCASWIILRKTEYGDGSVIINWQPPEGKGKCSVLGVETDSEFGCIKHQEGGPRLEAVTKHGSPWHYWEMVTCPQCNGNPAEFGGGRCRCAGIGVVRKYDDGYVGEEQTRLHPKEKERLEPPKCGECRQNIDLKWVACPYCGNRLNPVSVMVEVGSGNGGVVGRM